MNEMIPLKRILGAMSLVLLLAVVACSSSEEHSQHADATEIYTNGTMKADLTAPPNVPAPVGDRDAKQLTVDMEILEEVGEMTDGVSY
ncbi:MAG: nitrite reductase (NO-forming), partial [Candidatus Krumholzibacteriia bacterium]